MGSCDDGDGRAKRGYAAILLSMYHFYFAGPTQGVFPPSLRALGWSVTYGKDYAALGRLSTFEEDSGTSVRLPQMLGDKMEPGLEDD